MKNPTEISKIILQKRYLRKKEDGTQETIDEMLERVASTVANVSKQYGYSDQEVENQKETFKNIIYEQEFMPNSPTFTGAGTKLGQLSACFVLPVNDTLVDPNGGGIYDTMRDAAVIHQTGGGTGFSFSRLRANGDPVRSSQGVASGPISFLKVYNASTEAIKQGGTRRGANMGILRIDHPDIMEFISCKEDVTQITNFNLSVGITDEFMAAFKANSSYNLYNPRTGENSGQLDAVQVWNKLVECAWKTGEPGIVFLDRINRRNPNNHAEVIEATNPCGEQPLPPYGSCNLGSINLAKFVKNPYTELAEVDWNRLAVTTSISTIFLDQVIDANQYPIHQLAEKARKDRRIGLGIMGWAEMLVQLMIPYNSYKGTDMARQVMAFIKNQSMATSQRLAEERGTYPEWKGSQWQKAGLKVRNATLTTIAPTGTISIMAATPTMPVSGGCEPKFALVFTRNQAGALMLDVDGQFATVAKNEGWYSEEIMQKVEENGSCKNVDGVPLKWQKVFVVANEIEPQWHVRMQAAFQGGDDTDVVTQPLDAACSKTINFANEATKDDVKEVYEMAWDLGLKGITVYRDGSRFGQVLTTGNVEEKKEETTEVVNVGPALKPRLMESNGKSFVIPTHFGNMTLDIHMDHNNEPFEVMVNVGATGSDLMADAVGMGMLVSRIFRLRSNVPLDERVEIVIDTLKDIGGSGSYGFGPNRVTSLASAIAKGLRKFVDWKNSKSEGVQSSDALMAFTNSRHEEVFTVRENPTKMAAPQGAKYELCDECKNYTYVSQEGCGHCVNCGYSACK